MLDTLKQYIRANLPSLVLPLRFMYSPISTLISLRSDYRFSGMSVSERFDHIKKRNLWGDIHSVSGTGSNLEQTQQIRNELPKVIEKLRIKSMLDIPCGDFFWMRHVDLRVLESYIGADIVEELVTRNQKYSTPNISFKKINLISDPIPTVDLIFCRDCLVHLAISDIFKAISNIKNYKSRYLITTTFSNTNRTNIDIITGKWRPINLLLPPFNFPAPIDLIDEKCPEKGYGDKCLGVWEISDIP